MPLFGPKPNKAFVFILYTSVPPTSSQQAEIMNLLSSKGAPPFVFAEACQIPEEYWQVPAGLEDLYLKWRESYVKLVGSRYLVKHGIGTSSKKEAFKTRELCGFLVTTMSGVFV